ncbi:placenta growth factor isoform X1 [Mauremys mutica]|uniref:placenta growth factor isoform X1 n=1 Tax=Mauremys mutica TaxID=74926 RepID=UPI001D16F48E|nr:placenta growth factor isoform X1 [Mauremys mutica]
MQLLSSFLKLLVALALQASHTQQWDRFSRNSTSEGQVLPFQEVWGRSFCRPLEMLVDIVSEYPSEVEHMFSPSCISLQRCTGCCGDETLQCVPVEMANVTMQLLKMKPAGQVPYVELSFTEHRQCACRYGPSRLILIHHAGSCREQERPQGVSPLTVKASNPSTTRGLAGHHGPLAKWLSSTI